MFKELSALTSLLKNAGTITSKMKAMQEKLGDLRITGTSGGGMVSVELNGLSQALSCHIDPTAFQAGDREMLEDLIVSATNQALEKLKQATAQQMGEMTDGLGMPGLNEALSQLGNGGNP